MHTRSEPRIKVASFLSRSCLGSLMYTQRNNSRVKGRPALNQTATGASKHLKAAVLGVRYYLRLYRAGSARVVYSLIIVLVNDHHSEAVFAGANLRIKSQSVKVSEGPRGAGAKNLFFV